MAVCMAYYSYMWLYIKQILSNKAVQDLYSSPRLVFSLLVPSLWHKLFGIIVVPSVRLNQLH